MREGADLAERDPIPRGTNRLQFGPQASGHDVDLVPGSSEGFADFGGA